MNYTGSVVWFNPDDGYGFLQSPAFESDLFVHATDLSDGVRKTELTEGTAVRFRAEPSDGDPKAVDVTLVDESEVSDE